jgi:hypothetical protein
VGGSLSSPRFLSNRWGPPHSTRSPGFARRPAPAIGGSAVNRGHPRAAPPPNLADVYRQRVAELTRVLEADNAAEAWALVRSLVETITLVPEGGVLRIEVRGELAAILRIAEGAERARNAGRDADALAVQIKMVAGTGFEPVTFRL